MGGRGSESTLHNSKERELARLFNATRGPVNKEIMRQAHEVAREFIADHPIVQGKVHGIMSYDEFRDRYPKFWERYKKDKDLYEATLTAYAFTQHLGNGHSVIALNPALMNPKTLYRKYAEDRSGPHPFHPTGTMARDVTYHEMGHAAHNAWDAERIRLQHPYARMDLAAAATVIMDNNRSRTKRELSDNYHRAAARVSGYAGRSEHELVAEALTDVRANGRNAQPLSRAINYTLNNHEQALKRAQQLFERAQRKRTQKRAKR